MRGALITAFCAALVVAAVGGVIAVLVAMSGSSPSIFELSAGDCFVLPDFDAGDDTLALDGVDRVPCDAAHTAEVVHVGQLDPDQARQRPTDAALFDEVETRCRLTERAADELGFGVIAVIPNEAVWEPRGGPYLCVAIPYGGQPVDIGITALVVGD